jgi:hypothetical protein
MQSVIYQSPSEAVPSLGLYYFKELTMLGQSPGKPASDKQPLKFVVAYRISDETTKALMQRCIDTGYKPEQIARYALKRYLAEISHTKEG